MLAGCTSSLQPTEAPCPQEQRGRSTRGEYRRDEKKKPRKKRRERERGLKNSPAWTGRSNCSPRPLAGRSSPDQASRPHIRKAFQLDARLRSSQRSGRSPAVGTAWCRFSDPLSPEKPQRFDDREKKIKRLRPRSPRNVRRRKRGTYNKPGWQEFGGLLTAGVESLKRDGVVNSGSSLSSARRTRLVSVRK